MDKEKIDDLEAVRQITNILTNFSKEDIERIIRWSLEKLGIESYKKHEVDKPLVANPHSKKNIKDFYNEKRPNTDVRFAVLVNYYYKFEAPATERLDEINGDTLQEATRLVNRDRLKKPTETLNNAVKQGYLNRGKTRGFFTINTVGENLVAMNMPDNSGN